MAHQPCVWTSHGTLLCRTCKRVIAHMSHCRFRRTPVYASPMWVCHDVFTRETWLILQTFEYDTGAIQSRALHESRTLRMNVAPLLWLSCKSNKMGHDTHSPGVCVPWLIDMSTAFVTHWHVHWHANCNCMSIVTHWHVYCLRLINSPGVCVSWLVHVLHVCDMTHVRKKAADKTHLTCVPTHTHIHSHKHTQTHTRARHTCVRTYVGEKSLLIRQVTRTYIHIHENGFCWQDTTYSCETPGKKMPYVTCWQSHTNTRTPSADKIRYTHDIVKKRKVVVSVCSKLALLFNFKTPSRL